MNFGRFEVGSAPFGFSLMPEPFKHTDVNIDDDVFADEFGLFWLGARVSIYVGSRTYVEVKARRAGVKMNSRQ